MLDEQIARFRVSLLVDQEGAYHHRRVDIEHRSGSARVESRKDRPSAIPPTDELGEGASRGLELLDGWTRRRRCCSKDTGGGSTFHEVPRRAVHPLGADWDVEAMRSPGFQTLMIRAVEWAGTGDATYPVPEELKSEK